MSFQAVDDLEHVDTKTINLIRLSFKIPEGVIALLKFGIGDMNYKLGLINLSMQNYL